MSDENELQYDSPLFAFPVKRDAGAYFVLFSEWKGNHCAMTYLADYQKDPNTALHYLYLVAYTEFLKDKNIVLLRGEFQPYLTKTVRVLFLEFKKFNL